MEKKIIAVGIGAVIWGYAFSFLIYSIRRAKQDFVYDFGDWFFISLICLAAPISGALLIFGS